MADAATRPTSSGNRLVDASQLCRATREDGHPCQAAADRLTGLCPMHDPVRLANRRPSGAASVPPVDLDQLASLDLADPDGLKKFRSGVLLALFRKQLDPTRARTALDCAAQINTSGKDAESSSTLTSLASILKRALASDPDVPRETSAPGGEGGNPG